MLETFFKDVLELVSFGLQISINLSNALFIEHRGCASEIEDNMEVPFQTILATKLI
jgi:hypothetical protein